MLPIKNYFYFIIVSCFLLTSSALHCLLAKETLNEAITNVQKTYEKQEKTSAQNYPQISFNSTQYDAGEVYEGDVIAHDFIVKNTGTALLDITDVRPG